MRFSSVSSGLRGKHPILLDDPTIRGIDEELRVEQEGERNTRSRFPALFPRIFAVPVVGNVARACYSFGFAPFMALFTILVLFTAIKAPYFTLPFTGEHSMKYNTYVEAAQHMAERNDFTWYQLKYQSDPVRNPNGVFKEFGHIPLYEWGLFAAYKILPYGKIETKTRIFAHGVGVLILLTGFIFFRYWVPTKLALLVVFLMAINPIISFATFATVLDSLAILFMFVSLVLLNGYFESGNMSKLFWAGIVFGIGNCVKYSMILWTAPIAFLLLFYRRESRVGFLRDFGIYAFLGVISIVANLTSLSKLPESTGKATFLSIIWILIFFLIYEGIRKYRLRMDVIIKRIADSKILLLLSLLILFAAGIGMIVFTKLSTYVDIFLTDASLFFNPRVYAHMFRVQFKAYSTYTIFWLGIAGLGILFSTKGGDLKKVASAFLFGSVVYWVVASKAMFIHNYYTIIIMISFSLLAATTIYYLLVQISSVRIKWILILLFLVLIFPRAYEANTKMLGQKQDISEAIKFIMDHTDENDLILNESVLSPITIYTGRGLIFPKALHNRTIREDIHRIGFAETMKKYRIKYLFTPNENPLYIDFAPMFTETAIREPRFDRKRYIFNEIGERNQDMEMGYRELEDIVKRYGIDEKFKEEAKTGKFRFYSFVN